MLYKVFPIFCWVTLRSYDGCNIYVAWIPPDFEANFWPMAWCHTRIVIPNNCSFALGRSSMTRSPTNFHNSSIGLRLDEFPGQPKTLISFRLGNLLIGGMVHYHPKKLHLQDFKLNASIWSLLDEIGRVSKILRHSSAYTIFSQKYMHTS